MALPNALKLVEEWLLVTMTKMKFQVPVPDMRGARAARIWMYANQANHLNQVNHLVDNLLLTIRRLLGDLLVEWVVGERQNLHLDGW